MASGRQGWQNGENSIADQAPALEEAFLLHVSKFFRLEPFVLRNVVAEANQTILNNLYSAGHIHSVGAPVGVLDCPDPAVTYNFYPVSRTEQGLGRHSRLLI
jgi:hypothetical protein